MVKVLELIKKIPGGKVSTYKAIALKLKMHPRVVAKELGKNPHPIKIPCHRVVHKNGRIGGYKLGKKKKIELLKKEGVKIKNDRIDLKIFFHKL